MSAVIFVDVDDTFVHTAGSKRMAIPATIARIRELSASGSRLFCWSSGGAAYARTAAQEFGIGACFEAFLPKPTVMIDDQAPHEWTRLEVVHPSQLST